MRFRVEDINHDFFWGKVSKADGCWLWTGAVDSKGYGRQMVRRADGTGRASEGAYRISWAIHNGEIPNGLHVLHNCDNPLCVRPDHLRLGTHADNMADRVAKPVRWTKYGEDCHTAKLSSEMVAEIRAVRASNPGLSYAKIGAMFGVCGSNIGAIITGKTWPLGKIGPS